MISSEYQNMRFKYRVAGLCIHDGYVPLTRADQDRYRVLPGGSVELGEDARTALEREFVEETGHETQVEGLLWVVEIFFHLDGASYHELAFTYAISPKDPAILSNTWAHRTADGDARIEPRWFGLEGLENVPFQPASLQPLLRDPPKTTRHMIRKEPHRK